MPIYDRAELGAARLPWVDIDDFEFLQLGRAGQVGGAPASRTVQKVAPKERLIVVGGEVEAQWAGGRASLGKGQWLDLEADPVELANHGAAPAEVLRFAGHWTEAQRIGIAGYGPDYPTLYHYHDSDEYWFIFRGCFTLRYADRQYAMRPGLMLAAGMGYEHGAPNPEEPFDAVVFATRLEGQRRPSHLLSGKDGDPVPARTESALPGAHEAEGTLTGC